MPMDNPLFEPLQLPCGVIIKNRIVKAAMSDSLGDGRGDPTEKQVYLYRRWAEGGLGAAIIGEVQGNPYAAEKPGNLVLGPNSDSAKLRELAKAGCRNNAQLWLQLGHAGAMSHPPISMAKGPSALNLTGLTCTALSTTEIADAIQMFANTASMAKSLGFGGVQVHAAHGFLLSQFLSPLFNKRTDEFGGSISARMKILIETIDAVRNAVGPQFPVSVKLNATDMLEGGLSEDDALVVVSALENTSIDLIDISGGTYFPGAASASDGSGRGPYFLAFARRARKLTGKPLMVTGGFKTREQAEQAITCGVADIVGLARPLVLMPDLPVQWRSNPEADPQFPKFDAPPEGGVTAWYTMRITQIAEGRERDEPLSVSDALTAYTERDRAKTALWNQRFPL